jgi:hypothetical protein
MPKHKLLESIPLHVQKLNYKEGIFKLEDCVGEKTLNLDLLPKLGLAKRTFTSFFNCQLESV